MDKTRPIIIIKKKGGHGGHHGGAWKVAYADFVTAMMSLFIVLWLLSSSKPVQEAVGGYFRDPSGTAEKKGSSMAGAGEVFAISKEDMHKLKDELEQKVREMNDFKKLQSHVEMTITNEGLRIELMESASGTFFDSGRPELNADGRELLITLAKELGKLPNKISIEGHTDSKPYSSSGNYGNWELSSQVIQVRGFADQRLKKVKDPLDPANRRISVIVQYLEKPGDADAAKPSDAAEANTTGEAPPSKPSAAGEEKTPEAKAPAPAAAEPAKKP